MRSTPETSKDYEVVQRPLRILCFDIETSPTISAVWNKYQSDTVWEVQPWYVLSFSAKWLGGKQITRALPDYEGYEPGTTDDKALLADLYKLLDASDFSVSHNGDKFDIRKCKARFIKHGMEPLAFKRNVDTCKLARREFGFFSNKLDDIGQFLDVGRKVPTGGYSLWKDCMAGDPKAWNKLKRYNAGDTRLLEAVYLKLRGWDKSAPNINAILEREDGCPKCGATNLTKRGHSFSKVGKATRWQCMSCFGYSTGRYQKVTEMR